LNVGINLLAQVFPFLMKIPTRRRRMVSKLTDAMEEILNVLLARMKKDLDMDSVGEKEKSVIGLLSMFSVSGTGRVTHICKIVKGQGAESEFHLSKEEILSQVSQVTWMSIGVFSYFTTDESAASRRLRDYLQ
jgi:hypothetical protein